MIVVKGCMFRRCQRARRMSEMNPIGPGKMMARHFTVVPFDQGAPVNERDPMPNCSMSSHPPGVSFK
ncbi:hypothetical protein VTN31DRAFT_6853 [Thermomyces dupontii]|uniref:uncharacterized protein n=1 Tax=Talaromyces thermophilus TaxID=28565 RepID=UPI003743BED4